MKRLKLVTVCAVGILAVGAAVAAGTASAAAPEFGRCLKAPKVGKQYTGNFTDKACTLESGSKTGKYEWFPGVVKAKQRTAGGKGVLTTVGGLGVHCETESSVGEYSGTKEVKNVVVTFNGCESAGAKCETTGAATGELVTKPLEGIVGWENKAAKKAAFDLYPVGKTGLFIEFACVGLTVAVRGSVLVPIQTDKMSATIPLKYKATNGVQEVEHFEGEPNDVLESSFRGGAYEQSGQAISATATNQEKLELNAVV